jgi:tetratricopeptide (TPR) repeat protein
MTARAGRRDLPEGEREACVTTALEEIEKLYHAGDTDLMFFLIPMRARLLSLRGNHREAIDVMQKALPKWIKMVEEGNLLREKLFGLTQMESLPDGRITLRNTDLIQAYVQIAEYQEKLEDWVAAKKTYQKILMEFNDVDDFTPPQQRQVFFGSSVCAYHLKNYEIAIDLGEAAFVSRKVTEFRLLS